MKFNYFVNANFREVTAGKIKYELKLIKTRFTCCFRRFEYMPIMSCVKRKLTSVYAIKPFLIHILYRIKLLIKNIPYFIRKVFNKGIFRFFLKGLNKILFRINLLKLLSYVVYKKLKWGSYKFDKKKRISSLSSVLLAVKRMGGQNQFQHCYISDPKQVPSYVGFFTHKQVQNYNFLNFTKNKYQKQFISNNCRSIHKFSENKRDLNSIYL